MADEAKIVAALTFAKGNITSTSAGGSSINRDVAGSVYIRNVQKIATSKEAILMGDVTTPGLAYLRNLDATNFIEIFPDGTGAAVIKLKPKDEAVFRFGATAPQAKADTAEANLEYFIIQD